MTQHLIHGFNVSDGGRGSIGRLAPFLSSPMTHYYGWTFLFRLRFVNEETVEDLLPSIRHGDVLVAHSNGCLIAWELVQQGAPVAAVVCIQPALRRDTPWPEGLPVLCCYNEADWIVSMGRMWGRFVSVVNPWKNRHGWGAAGRNGFTLGQPTVENWDTGVLPFPAEGHSGIFQKPAIHHWAPLINYWIGERCNERREEAGYWREGRQGSQGV